MWEHRSDAPRRKRRPGGRAPTARDLATDPSVAVHDVVQIFDREGRSVWTTSFDLRADGERFEAALLDDVLNMDVDSFRAKYGLAAPLDTAPTPPDETPGWNPSSDAGGPRAGDIPWKRNP